MSGSSQVSKVRILYKAILRLHRGMPLDLRALGDQYVKDEFRRHKDAEPQFADVFMREWTAYALTISKQLGKRTSQQVLGLKLSDKQLDKFNEEQISQLFELFQEMQKPVDPENPLGSNPMVTSKSDS